MRCVLPTRATTYALLSLIAVIAAVQVIDPPEDIFHMDAPDQQADEANDLQRRIQSLRDWYSTSEPEAPVTVESLQLFLDELADVHFLPLVKEDGRAASIIDAGYSSTHMIADITMSELIGFGFPQGNAKKMASYLGSEPAPRPPSQLLINNSAAASAQHSAQLGAAVAAAVTSASTKIQLFNSSDKRPTVSSTVRWAKKHLEKSNAGGFYLTSIIQMLVDNAKVDLAPHILVMPASTSDRAYAREVVSSMTADQMEKYGSGEVDSAVKLIQTVILKIADFKMDEYIHNVAAFNSYEGSTDASSVKARFHHFTGLLMEVRYHKMFEVQKAVEKMVAVISPMPFLVNEVFAMWSSSPKDQASLAVVLKHVKDEVDVPVFTHSTPVKDKNKDKDKDKNKSDKKGSDWRSKGNWRGRDSNQDSGKSQSSDKRRNDNNDWRSRRNTEHGKGGGNGSTNGRDNRRDNTNAARAQVNSQILNGSNVIAQVNHLRQAKANEERHRDSEENVAKLCDAVSGIAEQLDNFVTASTMALHGDRFFDCHDHYALCDDDYVFYDAPEAPPAVMQVTTRRSTTLQRPRAPTEMSRLTRASNLAKVMSDCKLSKGPIIDTATDTDVIGSDSMAYATNAQSCTPFEYETISGGGVSNERADLATPLVTMLAAPIVKTSRSSIMSASTIHDAGFTMVSDSAGLSLHKDGLATEAIPDGNMYRMPVVDKARVDDEVNHAVRLHKKTVMARILKKMILHRKRGHRPADPVDCHGCALQLTRTPARRLKPEAKRTAESRGYVAGIDYITGLPPDNDGNTAVFGLVVASRQKNQSVAWYQPVKSHSGDDAIAAFKECEFRVSMMFPPGEFKLARVRSDCEKSLIGPLCAMLKARGIWPTNTEGYDHNGNAVVENRNRTLQQGVRAALVTATGARSRYSEIWGTAFVHINDCVNHTSYAGESSPVENCGGESVDLESEGSGVYGSLVRFYRAKERRDGKLDSNGAFGMYAGRSFTVPGGHRVIELNWNHESKRFDLLPTVDVKTVVFDNTVYPLTKLPMDGSSAENFDDFLDMFDTSTVKVDVYEIHKLLEHRLVKVPGSRVRAIEYKVHWKGCHKRDSTWEPEPNLVNCGAAAMVRKYRSINVPKVFHVTSLDPDYLATHEIIQRHKLNLPFDKCLTAYKLEFNAVTTLRMTELYGPERERVLKEEKAPRLRMNPEPKDDGRLKMRFLVMGHCEPAEWTAGMPLDSPTPASSSIKMMLAMSDETSEEEELSVGDVATAFLKGEEYSETDRPRYVVYREYRGSKLRVFRLRGSLYGQRDAPIRWFDTIRKWLVLEKGFTQCKNDVCLFRHPVTRVKLLLWVDDIFARGVRNHTDAFWTEVNARFGLKSSEYLDLGVTRTFIGVNLLKSKLNGKTVYCMDQNADVRAFLMDNPVVGGPL